MATWTAFLGTPAIHSVMNLNAMRIYIVTILLAVDDDGDDDLCASVNAIARSRLPLHPCATMTTDRAIALDFLSLVYKCIRELERASTPPGHMRERLSEPRAKFLCVLREIKFAISSRFNPSSVAIRLPCAPHFIYFRIEEKKVA